MTQRCIELLKLVPQWPATVLNLLKSSYIDKKKSSSDNFTLKEIALY